MGKVNSPAPGSFVTVSISSSSSASSCEKRWVSRLFAPSSVVRDIYQFIQSVDAIQLLQLSPQFFNSTWHRAILIELALNTYDSKMLVHAWMKQVRTVQLKKVSKCEHSSYRRVCISRLRSVKRALSVPANLTLASRSYPHEAPLQTLSLRSLPLTWRKELAGKPLAMNNLGISRWPDAQSHCFLHCAINGVVRE